MARGGGVEIVAICDIWSGTMTSKQAQVSALAFVAISLWFLTHRALAGEAPDANALAHSKGAVRSPLIVIPAAKDGNSQAIVVLARPASSNNLDDVKASVQLLLHREVIRQAVLIAARDGLGLNTRDEVLGERTPEVVAGGAATVVSNFQMEPGASRVFILRGNGDLKAETLVKHDLLPNSAAELEYLLKLTSLAENLSRTGLLEALKALGLKGEPNAYKAGAALPPEVEDRLEHLGFVENLTAVRDLHGAIRTDGESPARLGALARGYAQLGVLSEFHWHPAHKAFKARALLYAERLVAREPNSPWSYWHRALVRALAGMPRFAKADLEEARKHVDAGKVSGDAPPWLPLIDAFVANDHERLKVKDGSRHARLAALLRLMTVEFPSHTALALGVAQDVISAEPDCFRAYDALCRVGGVSNLHGATTAGPEALARNLPAKVGEVAKLPVGVRDAVGREGDLRGLAEALDRAGAPAVDRGEPSWGVLAHLVRETLFVQTYYRLNFLKEWLSVPVDDYWANAGQLVVGHRYRPFLQSLALPSHEGGRILAELGGRLDRGDLEFTAAPVFHELMRTKPPQGVEPWQFAWMHNDATIHDYSLAIEGSEAKTHAVLARTLLEINPRSDFAMAKLVEHDWDGVKDKVPAWEKELGDAAPALLGALGKHYTQSKQYDEAQKVLARYIRISPDAWAYEMIAEDYKAKGDLARWQETLDFYLAHVEDHGLHHAEIQVQIANHFMEQKRWKEAWPYADAAADTGALWAMECAARCAVGMEDWERAEALTKAATERYAPSTWTGWYRFCKKSGHGDVKAAQAWTEEYLAATYSRRDLAPPLVAAYFYWSTGSLKKAKDSFARAIEANPSETMGIAHMALVADQLGDAQERDLLLARLCTEFKDRAPKTVELALVFRGWLAGGCQGPADTAAAERVIASVAADNRGNLEFFAGCVLLTHGQAEAGRSYMKRSASSEKTYEWLKIIAADIVGQGKQDVKK
jgi:tetratricopeptide (TPR) repeat protein